MVYAAVSSPEDYTKNKTKTVSVRFVGQIPSDTDPRRIIADHLSPTVPLDKWTWLYRKERYHIWYVVTETDLQAEALANLQEIKVSDSLSLVLTNCGREKLHMRLHWLPAILTEAAICNHFRGIGTVLGYSDEKIDLLGFKKIRSGVREVTIEISENEKERLPHRLTIAGCPALLTFRGRPPLCLKCGEVGHVRGRCPYRRAEPRTEDPIPSPPPTAAQRVLNETVLRQRDTRKASEIESGSEDDDLDLNAIEAESRRPVTTTTEQMEFFHDATITTAPIDFSYSEGPSVLTPESVDMTTARSYRKAEDNPSPKRAKRVKTCPPLDSVFPMEPIETANRFTSLNDILETSTLDDT